ncbi:class I SAM-dependent methyltransferase [Deltaproteobacteria bacterium OttesenSCG-928-K17]|nr:class I SAM-dependent methyltransferase [Deltaproteobacteria bacterium OttesenSCG-928-K17]
MTANDITFQRPCPVCGHTSGRRLADLPFAAFDDETLGGDFILAGCPECGLAFYDSGLAEETLANYYRQNTHYVTSATPGGGGTSELDRQHQQEIFARLAPYLSALPPDAAIMEVGCGQGGLLEVLNDNGFKALGVEPLPAAAEMGRARGLDVQSGSAERLPFPEVEPSVLIYSHVMEHLLNPGRALAEAKKRLKSDGFIYIEVPDAEYYTQDGPPYQNFYLEHLNHFSSCSLAWLLNNQGFEVLEMGRSDFCLPGGRAQKVLWATAAVGGRKALNINDSGKGPSRPVPARPAISSSTPAMVFEAIDGYLKWSAAHPALSLLAELSEKKTPIWVWGLSQLTLLLLRISPLKDCRLAGFIDKDPYKLNRRLMRFEIFPPEVLCLCGQHDTIVLAAWGYENAMMEQLRRLGFKGRTISLYNQR